MSLHEIISSILSIALESSVLGLLPSPNDGHLLSSQCGLLLTELQRIIMHKTFVHVCLHFSWINM